ncbi:MAG: type II toxin-antitoxin system RelE/ParE family toxin [Syntrophales bacterium]|nr:type II toxin-antitoxin system RelE/ParE family toxin [Syntrophales bacterium]MCK9528836.1 type II toxin-antitoxin system RelE/ParE family toxin [Syntrophales bacterium]MDX9921070.1 type II toxin-antitoxin system RelE/ParE family toxin [Syntrophales bacterium]
MAYNVIYKKSVHRDLKKLSKPEVKRILDLIEKELSKQPESNPVLKGRFAGLRKYRVGDYRVIYALLGLDILILRIDNRKDVYKSEI